MLKIVFTLFNLQGTDAFKLPVFRSLRTVLVYHIFQALSRTFFVSFRSFSSCEGRAPGFRSSSRNFLILPHLVPFVKNFFRFSSNFSQIWHYLAALADSLDILPQHPPFVKRFLQNSSIIFVYYPSSQLRVIGSLLPPPGQAFADLRQRVSGIQAALRLDRQAPIIKIKIWMSETDLL